MNLDAYGDALARAFRQVEITYRTNSRRSYEIHVLDEDWARLRSLFAGTTAQGNSIFFIGNGGSAAIASHLANDFSNVGGFRARALNDPAALTSLANDKGYESVFSTQLETQAKAGDLLIAISSSGASENILRAVRTARGLGCDVVTFSGFSHANPLRYQGDLNFYVPASHYGIVEITHLALLHAVLDIGRGFPP